MNIKQARLIVNAHKRNLLINSFCNNGYFLVYIKQHENNNKNQSRERERERERERMLLCAASNYLIEFVIPWQNDQTGQ